MTWGRPGRADSGKCIVFMNPLLAAPVNDGDTHFPPGGQHHSFSFLFPGIFDFMGRTSDVWQFCTSIMVLSY